MYEIFLVSKIKANIFILDESIQLYWGIYMFSWKIVAVGKSNLIVVSISFIIFCPSSKIRVEKKDFFTILDGPPG